MRKPQALRARICSDTILCPIPTIYRPVNGRLLMDRPPVVIEKQKMALETESTAPRRGSRYRYSAPAPEAPAGAALSYAPVSVHRDDSRGASWKWLWLAVAITGVALLLFYPSDLLGLVERWATEAGW